MGDMQTTQHIIVAGAGPAGAIAALGLARLGYEVSVIAKGRSFQSCEGISERVVQALQGQSARHALQQVSAPSPRSVHWNGTHSSANTERLVSRQAFDDALRKDLKDAGITVISGQLRSWHESDQGVDAHYQSETLATKTLHGDFFVEARGRGVSAKAQERLKGPETLSLLLKWQTDSGQQKSMAASLPQGWAWLARLENGECYTQMTLASDTPGLPTKAQLKDFVLEQLHKVDEFKNFIGDGKIVGELTARSSTAILHSDPIGERSIRIGDAAMAVDPLSGNGIFQSLSTALSAPAVINTLLNRPEQKHVAQTFFRQRVNHSFMRFARMGRDFYQLEQQWPESAFWKQRAVWPDVQAAHEPIAVSKITIESRAVVDNHFIQSTDVVVTPDQPLGIWHMDGVELAPLVRSLMQKPLATHESLQTRFNQKFDNEQALYGWFQQQGLIEGTASL